MVIFSIMIRVVVPLLFNPHMHPGSIETSAGIKVLSKAIKVTNGLGIKCRDKSSQCSHDMEAFLSNLNACFTPLLEGWVRGYGGRAGPRRQFWLPFLAFQSPCGTEAKESIPSAIFFSIPAPCVFRTPLSLKILNLFLVLGTGKTN